MKCFRYVYIAAAVLLCFIFSQGVFAEDITFNTVKIYFSESTIPTIIEGDVIMKLYSEDGSNLLDTKTYEMRRGFGAFEIEFNVPEYAIGTKFKFSVSDAVQGVYHNGLCAPEQLLETYSMPDENGNQKYYTSFYMELNPRWNKEAIIEIPGIKNTLFYHCLEDDEVYVTKDLFDVLGIECAENLDTEKPGFTLSCGGNIAKFYYDDIYASFGEAGENLSRPSFKICGMPYAPLSRVAQYFLCNYIVTEENSFCKKISLTPPPYSDVYKNAEYVNSIDVSSRTDYLVWVDKSKYKVNVYLGENKSWRLVKAFPCAIGAKETPTIEGSFEYYQYQDKWQYDGYYCGPIMRFKDGYALHSTLIRDNGKTYDGRVGMKISHGCVRMHPQDIKWMVSYIPLYSRILVTG